MNQYSSDRTGFTVAILAIAACAAIAGLLLWLRNSDTLPFRQQAARPTPTIDTVQEAKVYRVKLEQRFDSDIKAFRKSNPGSDRRDMLRKKVISEAINMNPPPGLPAYAQGHLNRGEVDFRAKDFPDAVGEFQEAMNEAPWLAQGYRDLARARESVGDLQDAIDAWNSYLAAAPQATDGMEVKQRVTTLQRRILMGQSDPQLRDQIHRLQVAQQEEEDRQALIRAQQQAEEEALEEQRRQKQEREQVAQEQRCRQNFVGRWFENDLVCCGGSSSGSTSFVPPTAHGGSYIPGPGALFQISLSGNTVQVYEVRHGVCSAACSTYSEWTSDGYFVFQGTITEHSVNYSGNCSFTASGEIHHSDPYETVPVGAVRFYVSDDGNSLTWGGDTYRRQ